MSAHLPHVLTRPTRDCRPDDFRGMRASELGKVVTFWLGRGAGKQARDQAEKSILRAMKDSPEQALSALGHNERSTLAAYCRYGGAVNGTVIRLDLLARGVLQVVEMRRGSYHWAQWRNKPIAWLAERLALLRPGDVGRYWSYGYGQETTRPFPLYGVNPGLAAHIEPLGPAPWSIRGLKTQPQPEPARLPAEVALDLARVFAWVASRGQVRLNKSGEMGAPTQRALAKAVPLNEDAGYPLPDVQGLYFELLRGAGLLHIDEMEARPRPAAVARLFASSTAQQAHVWARAWLTCRFWFDGAGLCGEGTTWGNDDEDGERYTARQVLAWALSCLAHAQDEWFSLSDFLEGLYPLVGQGHYSSDRGRGGWAPRLAQAQGWEEKSGEARQRGMWFAHEGRWYANALMVTLASLGLVQRGRSRPGAATADCFRLTPWGEAVFGAPEIEPLADDPDARFFVVQPNFDVIVYLDRAGAAGAGLLGQLAESESAGSGPVRTFHVSQASIYRASEAGLSPVQITEFLRRHSQNELPANVVRSLSDWFARRESMVVRGDVTVVGFPSTAARDEFLAGQRGQPCGDRFALVAPRVSVKDSSALVSDHLAASRQTMMLDEHGRFRGGPLDTVQEARLRRLAERTEDGWRLSRSSVQRALAQGHRPAIISHWVLDHLAGPMPPLLACALDAWMDRAPAALEMGELLLLHVPDSEQFRALATSERVRPLLAGSPGPGWLVVPRQARKELTAVLTELGFRLGNELTPGPIVIEDEDEEDDDGPPPRTRRRRW